MNASSLKKASENPGRILSEAKMILSASNRCTVIVEGDADYRFFRQWIDTTCASLKSVNGKFNVKQVWKEARQRNFNSLFCLADLDYDEILKASPIKDDRFLYISLNPDVCDSGDGCNDLESALIKSGALDKLLMQRLPMNMVSDERKFASLIDEIRENLRSSAAKIGSFRAADQAYYYEYRESPIGQLEIQDDFFNAAKLGVDREKLRQILARSSRSSSSGMDEVLARADKIYSEHGTGWALCRGHDMCTMLTQHLASILQRRINPLDIESELRAAFEARMMEGAAFWRGLKRLKSIGDKRIFPV